MPQPASTARVTRQAHSGRASDAMQPIDGVGSHTVDNVAYVSALRPRMSDWRLS